MAYISPYIPPQNPGIARLIVSHFISYRDLTLRTVGECG
jgi:hypothetical protein